jgi:cobalt/nickel transport system permease protein
VWHALNNRDTVRASADMHIPDNFLSTPVWGSLDVVAIPAVALLARRAGRELDDARIPLLGVMGAFVFAAQMINFPVGIGTSGHLVGGALLACMLGAAPAALVMTAIIAIQAFVFQDGGVLALGANVFNMAIAGVLVGYLPIHFWGRTKRRKQAIFAGAFLSVMASASLALGELLISGIAMPRPVILISLALFAMSAITVAVVEAIEKLNPGLVQKPQASSGRAMVALSVAALLLGGVGFLMASSAPDGIQQIGVQLGLAAKTGFHAPLADYAVGYFESSWLRRASAGLAGLLLIYGVCLGAGRWIGRQRSA